MEFSGIKKLISETFADQYIGDDSLSTPKAILMKPSGLLPVMEFLHTSEPLYFDLLSCITGIDNGEQNNSMEVIYHLYSIPYHHHLVIKVGLDRNKPEIPSVCHIWKTANWHEREVYDLFGILFTNHPDMRRILLPADWEGHPLRKDYKQQEKYHGITVAYEAENKPDDIN